MKLMAAVLMVYLAAIPYLTKFEYITIQIVLAWKFLEVRKMIRNLNNFTEMLKNTETKLLSLLRLDIRKSLDIEKKTIKL